MRRSWLGYWVLFLAVGPLLVHPWVHPGGDSPVPGVFSGEVHEHCHSAHTLSHASPCHPADQGDPKEKDADCGVYCSLCAARCESVPLDLAARFIVGWLESISSGLYVAQQEPPLQWLDWPQPLSRRGPPSHLS